MKMAYYFKVRSFFLVATLSLGLSVASQPFALYTSGIVDSNGEGLINSVPGVPVTPGPLPQISTMPGRWWVMTFLQVDIVPLSRPNGVGMTRLGTMGESYSGGIDINNTGQVSGVYGTVGEEHVFITDPNGVGMTDLNVILPEGHVLRGGPAINNLGRIIIVSSIPGPATYGLMLAGPSLVSFIARDRKQKEAA